MVDEFDQPTHRERWERYSLVEPPSPLVSAQSSTQNLSQTVQMEMPLSTDEKPKKKKRKKVFAPSPYHHYAVDTKKKKLGLAALTVLIFYEVCGGPFGIEDIVQAGAPFYALLGFVLLLFWAFPEALITAELSTAMPEASGSVAWVDAAFGPFWAFQKGWLSWLSGVADNALYPILFLDCLVALVAEPGQHTLLERETGVTGEATNYIRLIVILVITALLTFLNYRGLDIVGNVAMVICLASLFPFFLFCVIAAFKVQPSRWLIQPVGGFTGVDWRLLLNTFFWNINFWESAASFAGEVEDPGKNYPTGMMIAVGMVFFSLFLPILVGTGASDAPYTDWSDGYFITLAKDLVGPWLGYWMMIGAAIANIGLFEAEMSSDSWQIAGMAERGILPSVLGARSTHDTPTYAILMSASGVVCLATMTFTEVIDMLNLLFCFGQIIEFFAFLELRRSRPDMPRPYKIPLGFHAMCVVLLLPIVFIGIILAFSSLKTVLASLLLSVAGTGVYYLLDIAKRRQWCAFETDGKAARLVTAQTDSYQNGHSQQLDSGDSTYFDSEDELLPESGSEGNSCNAGMEDGLPSP